MAHQSDEFRYSTRDLKVQNVLKAALFFYAKGPYGAEKDKMLAIREYNKLSILKKKRWQ